MTEIQIQRDARSGSSNKLTMRSWCLSLTLFLFTIGAPRVASALEVNVTYDPTDIPFPGPCTSAGAVDPCTAQFILDDQGQLQVVPLYEACKDPSDPTQFLNRTPELTAIMEQAASHWEDVILDDHTVDICYWWLDPDLGAPDASVLERDGDGKPTKARIRIPVDLSFLYDASPEDNEGFDMRPRLYRTTHPAEQAEAFSGSPPEILEVSYNGREANDDGRLDLLSVTLHEMDHALGSTVADNPECDKPGDVFYDLDSNLLGGAVMGLKAYEFEVKDDEGEVVGTDLDCAHLALGGIVACKPMGQEDKSVGELFDDPSTLEGFTVGQCASHQALMWFAFFPRSRTLPSVSDILALKLGGAWDEVDLPRKYTLASGDWISNDTWLGDRVPDPGDDVYIVNQSPPLFEITEITVGADGSAKNVYISDHNELEIVGGLLEVGDKVTVAGPNTTSGPLRPAPEPPDEDGDPPIGAPIPFSTLLVGLDGELRTIDMEVEEGGRFELEANGFARVGTLVTDGVVAGHGVVRVAGSLVNSRILSADGGTLTFFTPPGDLTTEPPILDLDGPLFSGDPLARLSAEDGDLEFDGIIDDPVMAAILVGDGHSITFTDGWHQGFSSSPQHRLELNGETTEAVVHGGSELGGVVRVNGIGRFTANVEFEPFSSLELDIGGLVAGTEYDQLQVDSNADIAGGTLALTLTDGFMPSFQDEFTLMTYSSHTGEFDTVTGIDLENGTPEGLRYFLEYQADALVLSVGLDGGTPGTPNCNGQTVSQQASVHGSTKGAAEFYGFGSVKEYMDALKDFCQG